MFYIAYNIESKAVFGAIQITECGLEPPNRLKRCYSLKRNKEFRYAYRTGKSAGCRSMVLIYAKGRADEVKIGFSVSKKLGNAVVRNRIKRRLREAVTPLIPNIKTGCKLIIIAKIPIKTEKLPAIESSMRYMMKKANLLINSDNISETKNSKQGSPSSIKEFSSSMTGQGCPPLKQESSSSMKGQDCPPSKQGSSSVAESEKGECKKDCSGKMGLQAGVSRAGESVCGTYE